MREVTKIIEYQCPMCRVSVPIAEVRAKQTRWWQTNIEVAIEGDATDYMAHIWQHQQRMI